MNCTPQDSVFLRSPQGAHQQVTDRHMDLMEMSTRFARYEAAVQAKKNFQNKGYDFLVKAERDDK